MWKIIKSIDAASFRLIMATIFVLAIYFDKTVQLHFKGSPPVYLAKNLDDRKKDYSPEHIPNGN